jgi:hypothetical protein
MQPSEQQRDTREKRQGEHRQTQQGEQTAWSSQLTALQNAYLEQFEQLAGDPEGRLAAQEYLCASDARYHGEVIGMGFLPKLYDRAALSAFDTLVTRTYAILEKMTERFIEDAEYRALFRFSPLLEKLIALPNKTACTIPICRIDLFLNEDDGSFKFCEFNTDGTSAMNEDAEVANALAVSATLKRFGTHHRLCAQELFDPWVETFLDLYYQSADSVPEPVVAIVDYAKSAVLPEQLEFRRRFERYGINCLVVDVASLEYLPGALYGRDVSEQHPAHNMPLRIDAVYRRAVTSELVQELENTGADVDSLLDPGQRIEICPRGAAALVAGVARGKVCMMGGFQTQVAHSKASFCLLHHPRTLEFLSEDERHFVREHVPFTTWLDESCIDISLVKSEREKWIIKPADGYASKGVQAGKSLSAAAWSALIDEKLEEEYIVQEYVPQFQTLNTLPVPLDDEGTPLFSSVEMAQRSAEYEPDSAYGLRPYNVLTGLFGYGGRFIGVYVRSGPDAIIVGARGGITLASLLVDFEPSAAQTVCPRPLWKDPDVPAFFRQ